MECVVSLWNGSPVIDQEVEMTMLCVESRKGWSLVHYHFTTFDRRFASL